MEEILIRHRNDISKAKRIVIKAGTSIVSTPLGFPSLPRMANIVEHAADLVRAGKEVIIVTSGAIGVGKQKLRHQTKYKNYGTEEGGNLLGPKTYNAAAAAAGQLGLMSLYATMFDQHDITTSQLLVTSFDFASPERCQTVRNVMEQLLYLGIVPLLNENDAVSGNQGYELFGNTFSDNDSLAAIVASGINAQLLIILTDVEGVYDRPPSHPQSKVIFNYTKKTEFEVGSKSLQGRGGMGAKVDAAMKAIKGGVPAVVIAAGGHPDTISKILNGEEWGTLFLGVNGELQDDSSSDSTPAPSTPNSTLIEEDIDISKLNEESKEKHDKKSEKLARIIAEGSRVGSRELQKVDSATRERILEEIARSLQENKAEILAANQLDIEQATTDGLSGPLLKRLKLTEQKIDTLADGIRCIARQVEPLGQIISRTELSENLILDKVSCPIGVLLIIFESRPDCLPQIVACAVRSGNGVVLKGGKEAEKSNQVLHRIVTEAIERGSDGKVPGSLVGLVTSRSDIPLLLKLDDVIDLVIPRGSAKLVRFIKDQTRIPVMGHAEGICHVFVDSDADVQKAISIVVDAKTDYPSACNAAETLLLHRNTIQSGVAQQILDALKNSGVEVLGSEEAVQLGLAIRRVEDFSNEYSDLVMSLEIVENVEGAIAHIHKYGSAHTDTIVTENKLVAEKFLQEVDSSCVFHNASTRFADGYRFGLGAEVGISTGRVGARGPVGVEGLLSFKWKLRSTDPSGHTVGSFAEGADNKKSYTFKSLPTI